MNEAEFSEALGKLLARAADTLDLEFIADELEAKAEAARHNKREDED